MKLLEFEIRAALESALTDLCDGLNNPSADEVADKLAPRVGAALAAAWRFNPYDRNVGAVLAALREQAPA